MKILKWSSLLIALVFPAASYADMPFDDCAALNRGEPRKYLQDYESAGRRSQNTIEVTADGVVETGGGSNERYKIMTPLGFFSERMSFRRTVEKASGQVETRNTEADYGIELEKLLSAKGQAKYVQKVRSQANDGDWESRPTLNVQIDVKEHEPVVLNGCSIMTELVEVRVFHEDGSLLDQRFETVYAPQAKLTFDARRISGGEQLVLRKVLSIEPIK